LTLRTASHTMIPSPTKVNGVEQEPAARTSQWMPLAAVGTLAALLLAVSWLTRPAADPADTTGYASALEACTAALVDAASAPDLGGWKVEAEAESRDVSAILMVRGDTEDLCVTSHDERGRFVASSSGWGRITPAASTALTYDTGQVLPGHDAATTLQAVAGRAPTGSSAVLVSLADGTTAQTDVTNGHYLALMNSVSLPDRIVALDSSGGEIARLADANGLNAK
jgi:hypothetical protein